jgi:hypothetical protein
MKTKTQHYVYVVRSAKKKGVKIGRSSSRAGLFARIGVAGNRYVPGAGQIWIKKVSLGTVAESNAKKELKRQGVNSIKGQEVFADKDLKSVLRAMRMVSSNKLPL